jgi:hypothetical protein
MFTLLKPITYLNGKGDHTMKKVFLILSLSPLGQAHGFALIKNNSKNTVRVTVDYPMNSGTNCADATIEITPGATHRLPPKGDDCVTSKIIFTMLHNGPHKNTQITGNYNDHECEITDTVVNVRKKDSNTIKKTLSFN